MTTDYRVGDVIRIDNSSLHPDWNGHLAIVIEIKRENVLRYKMCSNHFDTGTIAYGKVTHMLRPYIDEGIMDDTRDYLEAITTKENETCL